MFESKGTVQPSAVQRFYILGRIWLTAVKARAPRGDCNSNNNNNNKNNIKSNINKNNNRFYFYDSIS
jgi:hypothetical protein